MKYVIKPRIKAIEASSAQDFENQFNELMDELGSCPDYQVEISNGKFYAIIKYQNEVHIAETIAEEYELRGETFRCSECPECQDDYDARKKRCACKRAEYGFTYKDRHACEWFYKMLSQGKIKPL